MDEVAYGSEFVRSRVNLASTQLSTHSILFVICQHTQCRRELGGGGAFCPGLPAQKGKSDEVP